MAIWGATLTWVAVDYAVPGPNHQVVALRYTRSGLQVGHGGWVIVAGAVLLGVGVAVALVGPSRGIVAPGILAAVVAGVPPMEWLARSGAGGTSTGAAPFVPLLGSLIALVGLCLAIPAGRRGRVASLSAVIVGLALLGAIVVGYDRPYYAPHF